MVIKSKRCVSILISLTAVVVAVWILGNLLIDPELDGQGGQRNHFALPAAGTLRALFDALPAEGGGNTRMELLDGNSGAWAARWDMIAEAQEKLEICYFILDDDIFGVSFLGHLLHKAREGTRVKIMLDAIGTRLSRQISGNDYLDALAATGNVSIKIYRPFVFRFRDAFLTLNPFAIPASEHDKIIIADGRRAVIGGRNIAREYMAEPEDYERSFRDADVLLTGAAAGRALQSVFDRGFESSKAHDVQREVVDLRDSARDLLLAYEAMDSWLRGKPVSAETAATIRERGLSWLDDLEKLHGLKGVMKQKRSLGITAEVRLLDSRPRLLRSNDDISRSLAQITRVAQDEIFIQTPYLILSREAVSLLEEAAARGVRITILTNSPLSSDNALSQAFFLEQWPRLTARVPTLRLFVPGDHRTIHSKIGTVDGRLALIGTYNLDPVSMSLNGELVAAIWSDSFSKQLVSKARTLIAKGPPFVYEYRIARDAEGRHKKDPGGNIVVAFGAEDHSSPDEWKKIHWFRKLVRIARKIPGTSRLLWE